MQRPLRAAERSLAAAAKLCGIAVVAVDVAQQRRHELVERARDRRRRGARGCRGRARAAARAATPVAPTPTTGTFSAPCRTIACSAGKICLYARSPVAPKKTSASDERLRGHASFLLVPTLVFVRGDSASETWFQTRPTSDARRTPSHEEASGQRRVVRFP